jgi:hypothetical protein
MLVNFKSLTGKISGYAKNQSTIAATETKDSMPCPSRNYIYKKFSDNLGLTQL